MNKNKKNYKKKAEKLQKLNTVKGTKDHYGQMAVNYDFVLDKFKMFCDFFNFEKISTPILEYEDVFIKTLGVSSDIISKEMYNFVDQGGDKLVLRPEGTASVVRALISNSLQESHNKNFYYYGPMFRRERPQAGRLRQFHQVGVEVFGGRSFMDDIKVIILAEKFLTSIGIRKELFLQINSLGNLESRNKYVNELKKFLKSNFSLLSEESKKKIDSNTLRILDSKNEKDIKILDSSPKINDFLDDESKLFFKKIIDALTGLNISFEINPLLVRGLDYYNHTTFEYIFSDKKSQNAILAGGRYDGLVKSMGGSDLAGVGWAAGMERILMLLNYNEKAKKIISFFSTSDNLDENILKVFNNIPPLKFISLNIIDGKTFKKKMIKANKIKSFGCIIFGDDEWKQKKIIWKNFKDSSQKIFPTEELNKFLKKLDHA